MTSAAQTRREWTVTAPAPDAADLDERFVEGFVAADGFRIRYLAAGDGRPLVHLPGGHGVRLTAAHGLLSERHRVIVFEMPGFGESPENTRTATIEELAATMIRATAALGIDRFDLMGTSFGGKVACWAAIQAPERIRSLILEAPGAIRPDGWRFPESETTGAGAGAAAGAERRDTMRRLVTRLLGPNRDHEFEQRLRNLTTPTLVLFGTSDQTIEASLVGHLYKDLLPASSLVYVYGAGHAISADRPAAFADVVADYAERQQTFVVSARPSLIFP